MRPHDPDCLKKIPCDPSTWQTKEVEVLNLATDLCNTSGDQRKNEICRVLQIKDTEGNDEIKKSFLKDFKDFPM